MASLTPFILLPQLVACMEEAVTSGVFQK